ncbi:MAG: multidrug effflux MFS transporter [Alphaproteobacteria bacterium]|nr:multidrug effflux MFS transporter [Alphaproteobacteria bacterium]
MPHRTPSPLLFSILLASLSMLGPFSIDTYLPAFPAIGAGLGASDVEVQQTLTAYLLPFGVMMLWHGTLSDALGRRPVILAFMVLFVLGSIGCIFARSIEELWIGRALQGLSAGAGVAVGRAMIRDRFEGAAAQRMVSQVMMIFSLGPAIAPIIGGYLFVWFGWESIFVFLTAYSLLVLLASAVALPETLPREQRQSLRPATLLANYLRVGGRREFRLLAFALTFNFSSLMLYIASAPRLVLDHLRLGPEDFAWLFIPVVAGIFLGSLTANRMAGRIGAPRVVGLAYGIMFAAASLNLAWHATMPASVPWSILPLALHTFGMSMAMPNLTLLVLDLYPQIRGLVSSCQSFVQVTFTSAVAGLVAPFLFHAPLWLACGHAGFVLLGFLCWTRYRAGLRARERLLP